MNLAPKWAREAARVGLEIQLSREEYDAHVIGEAEHRVRLAVLRLALDKLPRD